MGRGSAIPGYDAEAEFYDLTWESFTLDVEFYRCRVEGAGRVLDCMCGTGRVAIGLARVGHEVDGIDASPVMLRHARVKARKETPAVRRRLRWRLGDLTRSDLGHGHDVAIIAANSYGLILSPRGRVAALRRIRGALRRHGKLLIALDSVRSYRQIRDGVPFPVAGGALGPSGNLYVHVMAETGSRSERIRSTSLHLVVDRKGRLKRSQLTETSTAVLSPVMVKRELKQAGFLPTQLFGGYDARPYSTSGRSFIIEAMAQ